MCKTNCVELLEGSQPKNQYEVPEQPVASAKDERRMHGLSGWGYAGMLNLTLTLVLDVGYPVVFLALVSLLPHRLLERRWVARVDELRHRWLPFPLLGSLQLSVWPIISPDRIPLADAQQLGILAGEPHELLVREFSVGGDVIPVLQDIVDKRRGRYQKRCSYGHYQD